jgi:uncharacterized protein (TIGR02246 family)
MNTILELEEKAIREKMQTIGLLFKNPTREFFRSFFTADCDYITFSGQHIKGIEENLEAHQALVKLWIFKGAELQSEIQQVKFLSDTIAIVIVKGAIKFRWQKSWPKNRLSINTNVFIKENDDWKLASFQNTRIKSPGIIQRLFMKKMK